MKIKNKIDPAKLLITFNVGLIPTIVGICIPGATVNISDGSNTILTVSVNSDSI